MIDLNTLRQHLLTQVQSFDTWGVFQKLFFDSIPPRSSPEGVLRILGFVHLYTASGIHIYALLDAVSAAIKRISAYSSSHPRSIPLLQTAIRIGLFVLLSFLWFLQNFRFGFLRPLLMFGLRQLGQVLGLKWTLLAPLLITLVADFLVGGVNVGGRVHYYLAVGGGILGLEWAERSQKNKQKNKFFAHVILALTSWIAIAVFEIVNEHHVALLTPMWTLLTLPLICTVVYPVMTFYLILSCFSTFFVTTFLIPFGHLCNEGTNAIFRFMSIFNLSFTVISAEILPLAGLLSAAFTLGWWFCHGKRARAILVLCFGLITIVSAAWIPKNTFTSRLVQLNVGQGDSLLVQKTASSSKTRSEMIDVGSARTTKPDQWLKQLSDYGALNIDGILLTHLDEDHQGALKWLATLVPISCVQTHESLWKSEKGKKLTQMIQRSQPNTRIASQACTQLIDQTWLGSGKHGKGNELMAGSLIEVDSETVYLAAGDADTHQEKIFLQHFWPIFEKYPHRIWKVSHHGSRFSSDAEVLKAIHPDEAWVSVGYNHYHHPHPQTLLKFSELNIPIHRTDVEGNLEVRSKPIQPFLLKTVLK